MTFSAFPNTSASPPHITVSTPFWAPASPPETGASMKSKPRFLASATGWAQNLDHPEAPVCLDILVDGVLVGQVLASCYREDLERAGIGSGRHSFEFTLPPELHFSP